jgi:hypothetical protein
MHAMSCVLSEYVHVHASMCMCMHLNAQVGMLKFGHECAHMHASMCPCLEMTQFETIVEILLFETDRKHNEVESLATWSMHKPLPSLLVLLSPKTPSSHTKSRDVTSVAEQAQATPVLPRLMQTQTFRKHP